MGNGTKKKDGEIIISVHSQMICSTNKSEEDERRIVVNTVCEHGLIAKLTGKRSLCITLHTFQFACNSLDI